MIAARSTATGRVVCRHGMVRSQRHKSSLRETLFCVHNMLMYVCLVASVARHSLLVVSRQQRQRMEDGLAGSEGLRWNPNYCICHVYDDHR